MVARPDLHISPPPPLGIGTHREGGGVDEQINAQIASRLQGDISPPPRSGGVPEIRRAICRLAATVHFAVKDKIPPDPDPNLSPIHR